MQAEKADLVQLNIEVSPLTKRLISDIQRMTRTDQGQYSKGTIVSMAVDIFLKYLNEGSTDLCSRYRRSKDIESGLDPDEGCEV